MSWLHNISIKCLLSPCSNNTAHSKLCVHQRSAQCIDCAQVHQRWLHVWLGLMTSVITLASCFSSPFPLPLTVGFKSFRTSLKIGNTLVGQRQQWLVCCAIHNRSGGESELLFTFIIYDLVCF